jgi:exopolyphosphatase/guanosine-5'-triphosphate,3'-diphosphate pyrophosphatase
LPKEKHNKKTFIEGYLMRRAALDMGTNSFLLTVAEVEEGELGEILTDQLRMVRLGQGVDATGHLHPDAKERARHALRDLLEYSASYGITAEDIRVVGTSALRDASDGAAFCEELHRELGLRILRIHGKSEARISWAGAWSGITLPQKAQSLLVDIGGGSTELIWENGQQAFSLQIGVVRARERFFRHDPPLDTEIHDLKEHLLALLAPLPLPAKPAHLLACAGTATTLAAVAEKIDPYDSTRVHGSRLSLHEIARQIELYQSLPLEQRKEIPGLSAQRADLILPGAILLHTLLEALQLQEAMISDRGVRFGLLLIDNISSFL